MWKIWLFFSVFKFSFSAPVETKKGSVATGDLGGLRCLLLSSPIQTCEDLKRYGNDIPKRLQKLYDKVKKPFMEIKNEEILDTSAMEILPTSLLYLIPRIRLGNITGSAAGKLIRDSPDDEALAIKLSSLLATDDDRQAFLQMLAPEYEGPEILLSEGVEREVARAMAIWYPTAGEWQYWHFDIALMAGSPVLAHLPSHFLNKMPPSVAEKFVFHLRNWRAEYDNNTLVWSSHSSQVKRMWTHATLKKHQLFPAVVRYAPYLLLGASPDEISTIVSYIQDPSQILPLLELPWSTLQSRALYDVIHEKYPTLLSNPTTLRHVVSNLLPRQIQQFDPATSNIETLGEGGFPTESQLLHHRVAHLVEKKQLGKSADSWKEDVALLGKLVHVLPSSSLEVFKTQHLPIQTINKVASSSLSYRQARYLTGNSTALSFEMVDSILGSKHHLKALPTAALNSQHRGMLPENVQRHLLRHIPTSNKALAAVLIEKTHLDIDDRPYLTALLENDHYDELLKLLSIRMTSPRMLSWAESLTAIAHESEILQRKIRALPSNIGSMLLAAYRRELGEDGWTTDNLIENPKSPLVRMLISNFQCIDMDLVNDVDVLPILGHYVRERKTLNLPFPKNMQYCCQKALTRYLKLKSSLRQWSDDSVGLMNLLEVFEVRAVGGYILASLPIDVIQSALVKNQIIKEIGSLPLPQLLTATSLSNLRVLANSFGKNVPEFHLRELTELGNLIWFLDAEQARHINVHHFKLLLETFEPSQPRAPCWNMQEREFWRDLIINAVGKPSSWRTGTLSLLGDLLYVFDEEDLEAVSAVARTESSDVIPQHSTFHVKVEWPGKLAPITYFEACLEALQGTERPSFKTSVRTLMRFYLESAQMLVKTIISSDTLIRLDTEVEENNHAAEIVDSSENIAIAPKEEGRIKRAISTKRGRIFKRVLNEDKLVSAEAKKNELLINGTRALTVITTVKENEVHITETFPRKSIQIGCDAIRVVGMPASFVLDEEDFKKMTDTELEDCAEVLGSLELPQNVRKAIWPRLTKWKESNNLLEVGNLVSAISEDDVTDLSLDISKPWGLESLSLLSQHVTHDETLSLLGDRFILSNPDIQIGLRFGSAVALGRIMCHLAQSRQQKLLNHPNVFVQLAPLLGASELDHYCITHMIGYARTAYGPPKDWSAEDVASLGVIVAGLDKSDWHKGLKAEALAGISPAAVSRIPPELFKELSEEQLSRLPALSIAAISPAQSQHLSPSQSEIVERARRQIPDKDLRSTRSASSARSVAPSAVMTCLAVMAAAIKFVF